MVLSRPTDAETSYSVSVELQTSVPPSPTHANTFTLQFSCMLGPLHLQLLLLVAFLATVCDAYSCTCDPLSLRSRCHAASCCHVLTRWLQPFSGYSCGSASTTSVLSTRCCFWLHTAPGPARICDLRLDGWHHCITSRTSVRVSRRCKHQMQTQPTDSFTTGEGPSSLLNHLHRHR